MKASENQFPSVTLEEVASDGSDLTNPAADHRRLFLGEDGVLHLRDSSGTVTNVGGGIADQGAFTYLDATEAAAPGTPASGKVRIYAKTDGRIYSKDDTGTEYGPFDAAGGSADLTDYRLGSAVLDNGTPSIGTYGDEFEYATQSDATTAGWAGTNSLSSSNWRVCGSSIWLGQDETTIGRGLVLATGGNLPDDFEVAVLLSGYQSFNNMVALGVTDTSGNGIAVVGKYSALAYTMTMASYAYSSTGSSGTALSNDDLWAPHWLALRRSSATTWRFRWSADGSTWTTVVASRTQTVSNAQNIFIGPLYNGGTREGLHIHRLLYGTADLGL